MTILRILDLLIFLFFIFGNLELKRISDTKSEQLDAIKHKLSEIQSQLSNKEIMFTEQKRLLKSVKEEYEEKFKVSYFQ